jgi:hypothetical protein
MRTAATTMSIAAALALLSASLLPVAKAQQDKPPQTKPQQRSPDPLLPLRNGQLVIWVLHMQSVLPQLGSVPRLGYKEQSAGTFGQTASSYGQTAGSYGLPADSSKISVPQSAPGSDAPAPASPNAGYHEQTAGSYGKPSSDYGVAASDYGQTAGSVGQTASSYGQTAGSYGQTAGSFGDSLSNIGRPPAAPPAPAPTMSAAQLKGELAAAFPHLQAHFVEVAPADLAVRLQQMQGRPEYPDALLGDLPSSWTPETSSHYFASVPGDESPSQPPSAHSVHSPRLYILSRAPNPSAARALEHWLTERATQEPPPPH